MSRQKHFLDCGCQSCVNDLLTTIEHMEEAITAALRIKDLWLYSSVVLEQERDEAIALQKMKERFEKALKC